MRIFSDFLTAFNKIMLPVGNYGIPRSQMPQIDSDLVPEFMQYLEDNEVEVSFHTVIVNKLSLTQSEVNKMKVWKLMSLMRKSNHKVPRIFISVDGYVIDGSHRMIAQLNIDRQSKIKVSVIHLPIRDVLRISKQFAGVRYRNVSDAKLS